MVGCRESKTVLSMSNKMVGSNNMSYVDNLHKCELSKILSVLRSNLQVIEYTYALVSKHVFKTCLILAHITYVS